MVDELYNTAILTLAGGIPHLGRLEAPHGSATTTARLCGSTITVDVCIDPAGKITAFAQQVKACALGQAAAAILGQQVIGASIAEITKAGDDLLALLKNQQTVPDGRFVGLNILAEVANYPQRYSSTCLAFDAAIAAGQQALKSQQ